MPIFVSQNQTKEFQKKRANVKLKNLSKYLENLEFDYTVTYSGLRGDRFKSLEQEINPYTARIVSREGDLLASAEAVRQLPAEDPDLNRILDILRSDFEDQLFFLCAQVFRDAIVFYSKEGKVKGILHICFSCNWIKDENDEDFEVDYKVFAQLKSEFIRLGHEIEMR